MLTRRRTLRLIGITLLSHALSGCSTADPTATLPQTLRIGSAQKKWQAANIQNYSFNSTVFCFCLSSGRPTRVTVRSGVVTDVVDVQTGMVLSHGRAWTVDSLFSLARREAIELPSRLEVSFHPKLGYPRRTSYGQQELDGGGIVEIDDLRALP